MQKIMTFTLLQMVLCIPLLAQWEVLNEGKLGSFHQIDFVSDNVGWGLLFEIYSKPNTLLKTNDFGRTWSEIDISKIDNMNIREIEFVSDSVGWVLAGHDRWEANKLYYTDNGGDSWEKLYESSRLEHICVTKENIVFVVKDDSEVLKIILFLFIAHPWVCW